MNRPTSLYLDLVRPMAALFVLLSHVGFQNLSGGQLGFFESVGVQAVDVFFVLSGFVIAHVSATREKDIKTYFVSRAARIYSVAIPALLLTAALDDIGLRENPTIYTGPFQALGPGLIVRCIFFINEQWNTHRFPGSDGPYWSLGFEVWYYIAFGGFIFSPRRWRWLIMTAILVFIGPKVALLFPLWLMGVALYHLCKAPPAIRPSIGWTLFVGPVFVLIAYQLLPHPALQPFTNVSFSLNRLWTFGQDYLVGFLFFLHLFGFTVISDAFSPWLEKHSRSIRWIAGATFSLYLTHLPIMHFLAAITPWLKTSPWMAVVLIVATPPLCLAFAELSERRKNIWRRAFFTGSPLFNRVLLSFRSRHL
ncbi:MAG TPA: acyltransferase [Xanthobacteraceae bacterium]